MACWTFHSGTSLPEKLQVLGSTFPHEHQSGYSILLPPALPTEASWSLQTNPDSSRISEGLKNNYLKYLHRLLRSSGFGEFTQVLKCGKKHMLNQYLKTFRTALNGQLYQKKSSALVWQSTSFLLQLMSTHVVALFLLSHPHSSVEQKYK